MVPEDILLSEVTGFSSRFMMIKLPITYLNILDKHIPQQCFLFSVTTTKRKDKVTHLVQKQQRYKLKSNKERNLQSSMACIL